MDRIVKVGKYPKNFTTPYRSLSQIGRERLIIFPANDGENNGLRYVVGWGIVNKVKKGEEYDVVLVNFGSGRSMKVFCKSEIARKQVYTLTKTHPVEVVGLYAKVKRKREDGKTVYVSGIYADFINGWYVPKSFDIKKINNEDLETLTEEREFEDVLEQFE